MVFMVGSRQAWDWSNSQDLYMVILRQEAETGLDVGFWSLKVYSQSLFL